MRVSLTRVALCVALVSTGSPALAQDATPPDTTTGWKLGTTLSANFSQSTYSSNWAGGDHGSFTWVLNFDGTAERQFSPTFNLKNQLQLAYGQTADQVVDPNNSNVLRWDSPDKTTDLILFESAARFTLGGIVDPYAALRVESQFLDQSNPVGTIKFNPWKLKESVGIARVIEKTPESEIITRLGVGVRQTYGKTFIAPPTLAKESFFSNDGGIEWQTDVTHPLAGKHILYKGQLLVFKPVFYSESDGLEDFDRAAIAADPTRESVADFWKETDVNFQNTFSAQITKIIGVNLFVQLIYDKFDTAANVDSSLPVAVQITEVDRNVRKAGQFKQTLSLALTYRVF